LNALHSRQLTCCAQIGQQEAMRLAADRVRERAAAVQVQQ
jgi:hypothetical protein